MTDKDQQKFAEQQKAIKEAHDRRVLAQKAAKAAKDDKK